MMAGGSDGEGLDGRGDGTVKVGDAGGGVAVEATDDHDAAVVRLVAVVEDEVVAGCVVADVADVGVSPCRSSPPQPARARPRITDSAALTPAREACIRHLRI